jgi:hypothetical protein
MTSDAVVVVVSLVGAGPVDSVPLVVSGTNVESSSPEEVFDGAGPVGLTGAGCTPVGVEPVGVTDGFGVTGVTGVTVPVPGVLVVEVVDVVAELSGSVPVISFPPP